MANNWRGAEILLYLVAALRYSRNLVVIRQYKKNLRKMTRQRGENGHDCLDYLKRTKRPKLSVPSSVSNSDDSISGFNDEDFLDSSSTDFGSDSESDTSSSSSSSDDISLSSFHTNTEDSETSDDSDEEEDEDNKENNVKKIIANGGNYDGGDDEIYEEDSDSDDVARIGKEDDKVSVKNEPCTTDEEESVANGNQNNNLENYEHSGGETENDGNHDENDIKPDPEALEFFKTVSTEGTYFEVKPDPDVTETIKKENVEETDSNHSSDVEFVTAKVMESIE